MRLLKSALIVALLLAPALPVAVHAGSNAPLFVNVLTDEPHRARMAIAFSKNQMLRGHPVTFFFNDKSVLMLSKGNAASFGEHQGILGELMAKGATVLACPMCMQHYGVKTEDLIDGVQLGNPELTGSALFKENTRTLTW